MPTRSLSLPPNYNDPYEYVAHISVGRSTAKYAQSSDIFLQGADSDAVFYIQSGQVKVTITSEQGKIATVAILEAGDFFGEGCLIGQSHRIASTKALINCVITTIKKVSMMEALDDEPLFARLFMNYLLRRKLRTEADVANLLLNSVEKRLVNLLLLLANYGREGNPPIVPILLDQETLAQMIGTTRSRVSHCMHKFRKLGYIDYNRRRIDVHQSLLRLS